jgi:hypothetical protein
MLGTRKDLSPFDREKWRIARQLPSRKCSAWASTAFRSLTPHFLRATFTKQEFTALSCATHTGSEIETKTSVTSDDRTT